LSSLTRELFSTSLFTVRCRPLFVALSLAALTAGGCSKAPTKDELLARANEDFAAELYDKAQEQYREVLRISPDDPLAMRQLAIILYNQNELPQVYDLLKRVAEIKPDDLEVQLKLAQVSVAVGDLPRAHDAAPAVLDKRPGDEQALIALASAATPDDVDDTRKLVEDLRAKDQDRAGYHLALAALAFRQRDSAGAEGEVEKAAKLDPKSVVAQTARADLAWSRNDIKTADQAFKSAVDLSPIRSPIRLRYADFKVRTGATAEAKAILEESSRRIPITCRHAFFI